MNEELPVPELKLKERDWSRFRWPVIALLGIFLLPFLAGTIQRIAIYQATGSETTDSLTDADIVKLKDHLQYDLARLDRKLSGKVPRSNYLIINTSANEFALYRGSQLIKKDKCSTGSYILLKNGDQQEWMFKTPKGEFSIKGKVTSPVWRKPDWAFVEAGLPVPSANHYSRYEYGVLGDYALSLGQGYLIHGTLYQRFLGLPVTHGCVRLNDENLELVYRSLRWGSKVYIY